MDELTPILEKMQRLLGYVPVGTVDLIHVLSHPDVIDLTQAYLDACKKRDEEGSKR